LPAAAVEPYPSQRITLIVPFPPGSATDSVTRHLAESIRAVTNATVVVENKPGADGNLAALAVLKAEPDEARKYPVTIGATPFPSTPQELGAFQEADIRRWAEIVGTAKIEKK
jgi:tripartite-type tricarboxylate transporter receptor subunit TctC